MQIPSEDGVYLVRFLLSIPVYISHPALNRATVKASLAALQPLMFTSMGSSRHLSSPSVLPPRPSRRVRALQHHLVGNNRPRVPYLRSLVPHLVRKTYLPTHIPVLQFLPSRTLSPLVIHTSSRRRPPGPMPLPNPLIKICSSPPP